MEDPTKADLESLISDQVEENSALEYKAAEALGRSEGKKHGITKHISALANAGGGRLIFGIKEFDEEDKKHLPEKIDPVDQTQFSREWMDQIASLVRPKIEGLKIYPIHVGPNPNDYCYIIDVPQGTTAHQATDHRYYKRRNFEAPAMEDYEIRDVMNRISHPVLSAEVRVNSRYPFEDSHIVVRVNNSSKVMARHYAVVVHFPLHISSSLIFPAEANLESDPERKKLWLFSFSNSPGAPLFPGSTLIHKIKFEHIQSLDPDPGESISDIRISLYADNMEKKNLTKNLTEAENGWT